MAKILPRKDVVVIGLGWTGSIISNELCDEGLEVVALERGPWRDTASDFNIGIAPDELRYNSRLDLMLRPAQSTFTARNDATQTALPMRRFGTFHPGNGVGGAGVHWAGITWRWSEYDFRLRSHYTERYGAAAIPDDMTIQDWPFAYEELEPFYDSFEYLAGVSGKAGNLGGQKQDGGNPFEAPRKRDFPNPPMMQTFGPTLFAETATKMGYKPFPVPSSLLSRTYTNPLGVTIGQCTFCGFCTNYGCANYSKASAQTTVLPVLMRKPNFELRTLCEVLKINLDRSGKRATGVTYVDTSGEEWEQPADLVISCAFMLDNVRLFLLSGIGKPYDHGTGEGVIGRNFCYQMANQVVGFFDKDKYDFNLFIGGGATGMAIDEFNNDNFDHGPLGFLGGGSTRCTPIGAEPISKRPTPPGTPTWGSTWKRVMRDSYLSNLSVGCEASSYASRDNFLDLDPTYKDRLGRPLMRITFNFPENDVRMSAYCTGKVAEIVRNMGAHTIVQNPRTRPWSVLPYQSTHVVGGTATGSNPSNSAVNRYMQSWDVPNVFTVGANVFPQNSGYNPTGTVGALAFKAANAIRTLYLKSPGPLVQA
ncbi:GMC family oxidoreductase [Roseomonas elaeocarpi]|uniref:GMC family oxidoreductase n=1 Tax=Roseomonas elaeocarpi TaxID=907779 RepID=A0ABV6JTS8_9PROT